MASLLARFVASILARSWCPICKGGQEVRIRVRELIKQRCERKEGGESVYLEKGPKGVPNPLFGIGAINPLDDLGQDAAVNQSLY